MIIAQLKNLVNFRSPGTEVKVIFRTLSGEMLTGEILCNEAGYHTKDDTLFIHVVEEE